MLLRLLCEEFLQALAGGGCPPSDAANHYVDQAGLDLLTKICLCLPSARFPVLIFKKGFPCGALVAHRFVEV